MKKLFTLAAMVVTVTTSGAVLAHGEKPKHGGIMQAASDLNFELVNKNGKAVIYVDDHGKPVPTAGASGKLTLLKGSQKSEVGLEPAGDNMFATKDDVAMVKGTKAIAALKLADKRAVNVRFSLK